MNRVTGVLWIIILATVAAYLLWMTLKPLIPYVAVIFVLLFIYRLIFKRSW